MAIIIDIHHVNDPTAIELALLKSQPAAVNVLEEDKESFLFSLQSSPKSCLIQLYLVYVYLIVFRYSSSSQPIVVVVYYTCMYAARTTGVYSKLARRLYNRSEQPENVGCE